MNPILLVDAGIALILIWKLLEGRKQGAVRRVGGLASLILALLGGRIVRDAFAEQVSERWLLAIVTKTLERARQSLGISDLLDNLREILAKAQLPAFLKTDVADRVSENIETALDSAIGSAASVIALRLSRWLLFLAAALVVYLLVRLIINGILDPLVRKIPLVKGVNRFLGMAAGLVTGVILSGLLLWLAYKLFPVLSEPGKLFAPEAVSASYLVRLFFRYLPGIGI